MEMFVTIELPSKGKAGYGPTLQLRPMTIGELKAYTGIVTNRDVEKRMSRLFRELIQGVDPSELTHGDREFLILQTYINSVGKTISVELPCPACEAVKTYTIDLTLQIPIKELENDEEEIEHDGKTFKVPYMRGRYLEFAEEIGRFDDKMLVALTYAVAGAESYKDYLDKPGMIPWYVKIRDASLKYDHGPKYDDVEIQCKECAERLWFPVFELFSI